MCFSWSLSYFYSITASDGNNITSEQQLTLGSQHKGQSAVKHENMASAVEII